eukprot:CAMPEP_0116931132 /NCGR_PEP_ID=MMETSP0467-20121206/27629_1 /TAXON_ID=283647 /ORGANISM="Mesodinium pulex, Strain SPMC105" /LENGTH=101 /DNA_ID=CAMNT_0004611503 /DNA_START=1017 /DNA_END=1322 /DNA_ORIENTATION=-
MNGHLPPSSNTHGTKFLAADAATSLPFIGDPVNTIRSNLLAVSSIATSGPPSKHAYAWKFRSRMNVAMVAENVGLISEGLRMTVFPVATAFNMGPNVVKMG